MPTKATTIEEQLNSSTKEEKIKPVDYTKEELAYRGQLITEMNNARDMRETPHPEFDGMTYSQYYDTNKRADLSFIPPKKNKQDTRIVTGFTREKDSTLLSALLANNFQPDITVYNESDMIYAELGNHMEDLVKKSREIEQWDGIRPLVYREMISQGDVFVEEIFECVYIPETDNLNEWKPGQPIKDAKFDDNKLKMRKVERCAVKLHQGKNVYLGNFFEEIHDKQDLVFTYELIPRTVAKAIYGKWDRWENVPYEVDNTVLVGNSGITYQDWNLTRTQKDFVGVLKIQKKFSNRYMIMLNGVMMLPINFPLSAISPDGEYTIKHQCFEQINGCAYGKGQPAKTKVDQAVHDEFLRLMIVLTEQQAAPPMGYRGKRVLSNDIFTAGRINNNMRDGDLFPILPQGVSLNNANFSMFNLIKEMIESKTINATFSGEKPQGDPTLGQLQMERQQQLLKLGLAFDSTKNLEKQLIWARIGNMIMQYSKPTSNKVAIDPKNPDGKIIEDIYRTFSLETTLQDGRQGIKIFEFTDKEFPTIRNQQKEEEQLSEYYGKPTQKVYFNGPAFIEMLKYRWVVNIVVTQENSDQIEQQLFVRNIREAKEIFGPDSVNDAYAKEAFAIKIKEDPTRFFIPEEQLQLKRQQAMSMGEPDGTKMLPSTKKKPLAPVTS